MFLQGWYAVHVGWEEHLVLVGAGTGESVSLLLGLE